MTNRRLTILIAIMLVLGGVFWFDHGWWGDSEQTLPTAVAATTPETGEYTERRLRASASELAAINPLGDWPAEAISEVLDRPIFNPSRRAYKPEPVKEPEPEEPEPVIEEALDVDLIGVLLGENGRFAMLKEGSSGKVLRLQEGQALDDWTLAEVRLRDVVVVRGEERKTLKLFEDKAASAAPQSDESQAVDEDEFSEEIEKKLERGLKQRRLQEERRKRSNAPRN